MEDAFIRIRNLKKIYKMGDEYIHALDGIDLDIKKGDIICLLGTSGSGKSTLLNAIAGLEKPTKGEINIGGVELTKLNEEQLTIFRRLNIGFVFQSYNLVPTLTALENVSLSLMFKGEDKKTREQKAIKILKAVGLEHRLKHKPKEMSGGQQQRVSIARAFVDNPKIIFADEPTGNLDSKTTEEVLNLITKIAKEHNQTMIIVSHDEEVTNFADRTYHMQDGKIYKIKTNEKGEETNEKAN
ncbi:ABC transporter ATP-binding protein [Citroniella saccharovorans]|uniref:ABC transporter ATP-binding protein n=1 Tax=Citroniella saccharovorans TaxID=2053367 RepID=A0AAW9MMS4_9FIRM|nr:ABC transporter ATP-binding protein [Citroniella saccharovorans]MEB3428828.1 ABC transporter ATP-binding protein [Citroniella saccharovorans]